MHYTCGLWLTLIHPAIAWSRGLRQTRCKASRSRIYMTNLYTFIVVVLVPVQLQVWVAVIIIITQHVLWALDYLWSCGANGASPTDVVRLRRRWWIRRTNAAGIKFNMHSWMNGQMDMRWKICIYARWNSVTFGLGFTVFIIIIVLIYIKPCSLYMSYLTRFKM